jgi:hypothetical protein
LTSSRRSGESVTEPYRIDPVSGCWVWTRAKTRAGYGSMAASSPRRTLYAHRVVYERAFGPIPAGLHIDHLCRNPACVNIDLTARQQRQFLQAGCRREQILMDREQGVAAGVTGGPTGGPKPHAAG